MASSSRAVTWLGVLLVLAGLGMLGYVAWQYFGTDYVSGRRHSAIVEELETGWAEGAQAVRVDEGSARAVVRIPRFGRDYAVPLLEGTSADVLAAGFGHVEGTAAPGARGNFVLSGHRVTHGEPLRDMPSLEPGDRVVVETAEATHTYELVTAGDALTVSFSEGWVLDRDPVNPDAGEVTAPDARALLTLVTCAELFHTDDRLVAFGVLVGSESRLG